MPLLMPPLRIGKRTRFCESPIPNPQRSSTAEGWSPQASIVGKKLVAMRIEQFQRAAAAAGDAGQRVFGDLHVQAGFLAQQATHVAQQRAAAREHDAQLGDRKSAVQGKSVSGSGD